jgi:hypothetical protein
MKSAVKITGLYALFSSLWIVLSDKVLALLFRDAATLTLLASAKGLFFVTVTSLLLYYMIRRELRMKNAVIVQLDKEVEIREQLIRELHHRIKNNLQVVIGLMNIETADREFSQEVKERISNKLISMMSVFNIVYDLRDMRSVSLQTVLGEYQRISFRNLDVGKAEQDVSYSIEVIVNCLMLVDSLIEIYLGGDDSIAARIVAEEAGRIEVKFQCPGSVLKEPDAKDLAFLELQVKSIDGSLAFDREQSTVRILFSRLK